jgi:DNA-binding Xre family transcriptional regulator
MLKFQLKELLECKGYKANAQVLRNIGFSYTTAYKLLHGNVSSINFKHLEALCVFLNCTPNDLYRFAPENPLQVPKYHALWQIREKKDQLENPADLVKRMNPEQLERANQLLREIVAVS